MAPQGQGMTILPAVVLLPVAVAIVLLLVSGALARRVLMLAGAAAYAVLAWLAVASASGAQNPAIAPLAGEAWGGLLRLDALGAVFLGIQATLFLAVAFYALGYLKSEDAGPRRDFQEGLPFVNAPGAVFAACLFFFVAAMSLVACTPHLGLLWVGVEATTLASAPLIYFHRHRRSLEATWKYIMICSVGIALALLGNMLLAVAAQDSGTGGSMQLATLIAHAPAMNSAWLKTAFIVILVGYGTKMGLAPLHTWLPDAHSEAPSLVSAMLSGTLLNCAFLGILRSFQVISAAGLGDYGQTLLLGFGLLSITFAAVFILGQGDFKRILAYSSVEHMGILALGIGIGGGATYGAMLHAVNHSITKAMLFLLAGNILDLYHTKSSYDVRGVLRVQPWTGALWIMGFLAITGTPPFGVFVSELTILKAALDTGRPVVAGAYSLLLAIIFLGMGPPVLRMAQGAPTPGIRQSRGEGLFFLLPPAALALCALTLGLAVPKPLNDLLLQAARLLGA